MQRKLFTLLLTTLACLPVAYTATAQEKPAFATRAFDAEKLKSKKTADLDTTLIPRIDAAFKGEETVQAAMATDIKAIRAGKTPQARASLAAAYQAKYAKDAQRIAAKGNLTQDIAAQLRAANPGMTFTATATQVSGEMKTAQSQPSPARAPTSLDTVRDLAGADFGFISDSNCSPGWGDSTRSGGYMKSESEGCMTSGLTFAEFDIPADKKGRVEMTANLLSEAHTIASYSDAVSVLRLIRLRDDHELDTVSVGSYAQSTFFGDDAKQDFMGASIVRDLEPGRYRVEAHTRSYGSNKGMAWAVAESRVQQWRVKIITSPK